MPIRIEIIETSDDGRPIAMRSCKCFTLDEVLAGTTADREHVLGDEIPVGEELI